MKLNKLFKGNYKGLLSAAIFALLGIQAAKADYPGTILADKPIGFYRLNETGQATTAVDSSASGAFPGLYVQNYGSDGTTVYPIEGLPGIDTNSIELSAAAAPDYVAVGYYPQFNAAGPFSFEIWILPNSIPSGGAYRCPIGNSPAYDDAIESGWYVYQTPGEPSYLELVVESSGTYISTTNYAIGNA